MKNKLAIALFAGSALIAAPAFAADPPAQYSQADEYSWYLELRAGGPVAGDHEFNSGGIIGDYEPDTGYHIAASIGKQIDYNWRAEISLSITHGEDGQAVLVGGAVVPHTGDVDILTVLGSVLYDFNTSGILRPFVGVGIGLARVDVDNLTGGGFATNGDDVVFAAALHLGFNIPVGERTSFTTRYSLGMLGGGDFAVTGGAPGQVTSTNSEVEHLFTAGFRVNLN